MAYNYIVYYKENRDYITIEHDFYNKTIDVFYNRNKVFSTTLKKCKTRETFEFSYLIFDYQLEVNTHHFLFFKKDKFILKENGVAFKKSKFTSKTWDVHTKKSDYHIHVLYNDFTSSMSVTINDHLLFDTLNKVKAFERKVNKIEYDNQKFIFIKKRVEDELFSIALKMNNRDIQYCKEDLLFINFWALLKRNSRNVSLWTYLKTKWLECIILPLLLFGILCFSIYVIYGLQFKSVAQEVRVLAIYLIVDFVLIIGLYIIGFLLYKRRFKN